MIRKYLLPVLALLGVAAAIAMVVEGNRTPPATKPIFQPAETPFTSSIFGPGIIEASTQNISIGTPVAGVVTDVYVKGDDRVKTGEPLFKVDTRDLDAQLIPAEAKVDEVQSQLSAANANVAQAQQTLAKAENHLAVGKNLSVGVSITAEDLAGRNSDVALAKAAVDSAQAQVQQIQTQIASAKAQVRQIQDEIKIRTVRAPISGSVLQLQIFPGEYAQSGVASTPLMIVGDDNILYVRVEIDQSDAWRFRPGSQAIAYVRGNAKLKAPLEYVRTDPAVVPQTLFTGDSTQRTDTRVLQVIYRFDHSSLPTYVGQLMDVFIQAPPITSSEAQTPEPPTSKGNSSGAVPGSTGGKS